MLGDVHSSHEVGFSSEESSLCIMLSSQKAPLMCSRPEAWWIHHAGGVQKQVMMGNQCNHLSLGIEVSGILAMCQPKRKQVSELQVLGDRLGPSAAAPCGTWQDQVQGVPKSCLLLWEFIL